MSEQESPLALAIHAIGEGVFNTHLGEAILSASEFELLEPQLLSSAMVTQLGLALNALANHHYHGGQNMTDAEILDERADNFFIMATIFKHQTEMMRERLAAKNPGMIVPMKATQ